MVSLETIKGDEKWILSCDGGGIRGVITLQCLKHLEAHFGKSCFEIFDMFAGTSTGALVAGALASKKLSVEQLIALYRNSREDFFSRTWSSYLLDHLVIKYKKEPVHRMLREAFRDMRLQDCQKDILITATDTVRSETIYFSYFQNDGSPYGTYRVIKLRDAIEASLSAPTYFAPHGRFVDGGVGSYNNPCYAAAVEALRYSTSSNNTAVYQPGAVRILSFGTGAQVNKMARDEAMSTSNLGWMEYVIGEGMDQARNQQSYICDRELCQKKPCQNEPAPVIPAVKFFRYQVFLNIETLQGMYIHIPTDFDPGMLTLDATDDDSYAILNEVGLKFGDYLKGKNFFLNESCHWERYDLLKAPTPDPKELEEEFVKIDEQLD
jgi:hypothetical protein